MRLPGIVVALAAALLGPAAIADSWAPARQEIYFSEDNTVRLTVTPREIRSPLDYFDGLIAGEETPARVGTATSAHGVLERRGPGNRWRVVWDRPLLNDIAPVSALVSANGHYTVTFDDWHFVGTGEHVVVIYGPDGSVIRSLSLGDLVPEFYVEALPRSVSSIHWGGEHRITAAEDRLILRVVVPPEDERTRNVEYAELAVELSSGRVLPSEGSRWQAALGQAQRVAEARAAAQERARAAFIAPLRGPSTDGERDWHLYLVEAYFRLDPDWNGGYPRTHVLRSPTRLDYAPSRRWLCDTLQQAQPPETVMIASPASPENLVRVLAECAGRRTLARTRIYIAVPQEYRERSLAALAPTGATVRWIDPDSPIPQRSERLQRLESR